MNMGQDDVVILDEQPVPGRADTSIGNATTDYVAKIYVPDIEQRHGWREFYVMRDRQKPGRSVGFRKPGDT